MKLYIVTFLVTLTLLGCQEKSTDAGDYVFVGGEIINPNNDYVMLYNPNTESDTLHLDEHNRFTYKVKNFIPGLYTFTHGGEYQMILLEPKDSIMFRLNTVDFDESLVFTGEGSKKNNYLIRTFLENEKENKKLSDYCQMEPEDFMVYLDSSRAKRQNELNYFIEKKSPSDLFIKIAQASINYNYYANKEIYPFGYYGYNKLIHFKDLPDGFYDFRENVDYNFTDLKEFYVYNRFLFSHFNNIALEKFYDTHNHDAPFNRSDISYNLEKLSLIDSLVSNTHIKNYLLKHTARDFIINSKNEPEINEILFSYTEKSTNLEDKSSVEYLVACIEKLKAGNPIPNVSVVNYDGTETNLNSIITNPSVIFFWSSNFKMNYKNSHYKVKSLKSKFPNIDFIAININDDDEKYWKKTLKRFKFPTQNEYQFIEPNKALNELVVNSVSKAFIINKDFTILNSHANLFSEDFENQLHELNK